MFISYTLGTPTNNRKSKMTTYTYTAATYNGKKGFFAERRIDGVYAGKMFGATKKAAREAFDAE